MEKREFREGEIYNGYKVTRKVDLTELQAVLYELEHLKSGAQIVHIANDDEENFFNLSFRTFPSSSNGVAHILEHTVLCGSEKYPVKDPFFSMLRRSLHTFMNAMTGPDWTCYPAASQVEKDFYNLLDVYIDAVFHPLLDERSFKQEGIRLEFSSMTDPSMPLEYKGIVYNEMKGVMSSVNERIANEISKGLFPDVSYGYNFGGDPAEIPQLTYEEFKEFHNTYYHPGRCIFFFYGNLPLEKHLDVLNKSILNATEKPKPLPPFPLQPRFKERKQLTGSYPANAGASGEDKAHLTFAWLTTSIKEQEEVMSICVLESLLMDNDASLLKKALLKSGLCSQAHSMVDVELSEVPVVLTLKGCNANDADAVETLIYNTLKEVADAGISIEKIEPILHQIEFDRSEIVGDGHPFGLVLFMRSIPLKQHGVFPEEGLKVHEIINNLREKISNDVNYLPNLLRKHFIDNQHAVRLVMTPDKNLMAEEAKKEQALLNEERMKLNEQQVEDLVTQAKDLAAFQEDQENQDLDVLPKVTLQDVSENPTVYSLKHITNGKVEIFHHACFTNEILYADIIYDLPNLTLEELPYAQFLASLLTQMGSGGKTYEEVLDYMQAYTGSVSAGFGYFYSASNHLACTPYFSLKGKALYRNAEKLFHLFINILNSVDFTNKSRLKEIVQKYAVSLRTSINQQALRYATNLAFSTLDLGGNLSYQWSGLAFYHFFLELADNFDSRYEELVTMLQKLYIKIIGNGNPHLVLSCDEEMYQNLDENDFYTIEEIPCRFQEKWSQNAIIEPVKSQGRAISAAISYAVQACLTVSYTTPEAPLLRIAANLFDNVTLHRKIREIGGAYGGGASSHPLSGRFNFYSYRDPNIVSTLEAFKESIQVILQGQFDDEDLEAAKLEVIQGLDMPVSPGSKARLAYEWMRHGLDFDTRKNYRSRIISATKEEIIAALTSVLIPQIQQAPAIVFAGKELLEKENTQLISKGFAALDILKI